MCAYPFLFTYLFCSAAQASRSTCQADIRDQHARIVFWFLQLKARFSIRFEAILLTTLQKVTVQTCFLFTAEKMILKNEAVQETSALAQSLQVIAVMQLEPFKLIPFYKVKVKLNDGHLLFVFKSLKGCLFFLLFRIV